MTNLTTSKVVERDGLRVVVCPATYRMAITRMQLVDRERKRLGDMPPAAADDVIAAVTTASQWAMLTSVVIESGFDHWPLTIDEFLDLPETFVDDWYVAALSLNPQLRPKEPETPNGPKAPNG